MKIKNILENIVEGYLMFCFMSVHVLVLMFLTVALTKGFYLEFIVVLLSAGFGTFITIYLVYYYHKFSI